MSETRTDVIVSQPGTADRRVYIDFIKILAILMVVFNHTSTKGFLLFTQYRESALYPFYLFNAVLIKIAVPLFFMCSGALLLGKKESYKVLLRKRFLRFFLILIVMSATIYLYNRIRAGKSVSVAQFLKKIWQGDISVTFWYLYRYLMYILMLPLLRKIAKGITKTDCIWIIILYSIIMSIPMIEFLIWKGKVTYYEQIFLIIEPDYVFFPLIGYYIDKTNIPEKNGKPILILVLLSIVAIGINCVMTHYRCTLLGAWKSPNCETFLSSLTFVPTIAVFYICKVWFSKHKPGPRAEKMIITLSGLTFGIYLLERIGRMETEGIYEYVRPYIHSLPASWVWVLCACVLCGLAVFVLKKIPGLKKFL